MCSSDTCTIWHALLYPLPIWEIPTHAVSFINNTQPSASHQSVCGEMFQLCMAAPKNQRLCKYLIIGQVKQADKHPLYVLLRHVC